MKISSFAWLLFLLQEQTVRNGVTGFIPRTSRRQYASTKTTSSSTTTTTKLAAGRVPLHPPPPPPPELPQSPLDQIDSLMNKVLGNIPSSIDNVAGDVTDKLDNVVDNLNVVDQMLSPVSRISEIMESFGLVDQVSDILRELEKVDAKRLEQLAALSTKLQEWIHVNVPSAEPLYQELAKQVGALIQWNNGDAAVAVSPTLVVTAVATLWTVTTVISIAGDNGEAGVERPYPVNKYDPISARVYFRKRIPLMISRGLQVLSQSLSFGLNLLGDRLSGEEVSQETENLRGQQLAELLTVLGPTYIKVGQSLSIRTDLLSPAYVRGLATLQDQVPPFPSDIAFEMIQDEWGVNSVYDVVRDITPEPIAAASLGQVYKATLKDGTEVAIKVQRPNIMNQIALDMHLLREVAPVIKSLFNLNSDTVGTVDAWGKGFVDELDYLEEARNAQVFMQEIQKTPLKDVVFAPTVREEFSTDKVLVSEWVDGERLDQSSSEDVTILCSIAMNTYLTMLLEVGLLHCDPHPGNLLRSKSDGRLCILDWGMVTRLNENLQLTLIEHVAHLTSADYDEIPRDLLLLDFIPKDKEHLINDSDLVYVLADIYGAWTKGGGAAAVNVNEVVNQLQDLTARKGNLFQIPPYFAYIAKSFSVLEGIGLSNDAKYSIINECLPYISQRLLTDEEKMGPALSTFIFGPDKNNVKTRIIDYDRVEQLITGFGNYTSSAAAVALLSSSASALAEETTALKRSIDDNDAATSSSTTAPSNTKVLIEKASDQILDLLFAEEETPFQSILLEQLAKIVASSSRSVFTQIRESSGVLPSGRTVLGTIVDPLGLFRTSPLVRMNEMDDRIVDNTRKLLSLVQQQQQQLLFGPNATSTDLVTVINESDLSREDIIELSAMITRKVWNRRVGILRTGNRFSRELLTLFADKLERGERDSRKVPAVETAEEDEQPQAEEKKKLPATSSFTNDISSRMVVEEPDPTTAQARATSMKTTATATAATRTQPKLAQATVTAVETATVTTTATSLPPTSSVATPATVALNGDKSEDRLSNARRLLSASAATDLAPPPATPAASKRRRRSNPEERLSNARKLLNEIENMKHPDEHAEDLRLNDSSKSEKATASILESKV